MKNKSQKNLEKTISKRFFLLSSFKALVIGAISWRFFDLQMVNKAVECRNDKRILIFYIDGSQKCDGP